MSQYNIRKPIDLGPKLEEERLAHTLGHTSIIASVQNSSYELQNAN